MKGILIAGLMAVLLVSAVEALSCVQCNSWGNSCVSSTATECPSHANASCISSSANSSLERATGSYQSMSCSAENCSEEARVTAFTVHVSAEERFHFVSQCCQGKACNSTSDALADPPLKNVSRSVECPACYESHGTSCTGKRWQCYEREQCIFLLADLKTGSFFLRGFQEQTSFCRSLGHYAAETESKRLVLKGCSNVSNSTCQFLSGENKTVGGVTFRKFECTDANSLTPMSTPAASHNMGSKASLNFLALASLLLLGLLL
ncbi:Ly6/PLAUR domain-containing protein 8 [Saguinus oedipus]|uniref:Ly6/PLAUR domain-containing protein 8 n=1 Tax=Saguinus oedipus TaxID=9490 RepID=A0ABQ9TM10_SAGOE|nr:Ly6/PLAUR domain-containing protein 8 [Saguinus oedipus]